MKTSVLILAAGPALRGWTEEAPKQLALIAGEPLILRTLRQLKERGYDEEVIVVTHNKAIQAAVPRYFEPANYYWRSETRLSTQELWAERTIMLHGDTIFSPKAVDAIVAEQSPLMFIGIADKVHAEAFVFTAEGQDRVRAAAQAATEMAYAGAEAPLLGELGLTTPYLQGERHMHWAFYRALSGLPLQNLTRRVFTPEIHRILLSDYTRDIDSPKQHAQFCANHKGA